MSEIFGRVAMTSDGGADHIRAHPPRSGIMRLARIVILTGIVSGLLLMIGPSALAECAGVDSRPSFGQVAPSARRIIVGTVTESSGGTLFELRVDEVLRGSSRRYIEFEDLRLGLPLEDTAECKAAAMLRAKVGDRLAIAFFARLPGVRARVTAAASILEQSDSDRDSGIERLTLGEVRRLAGHAPDGSTLPEDRGLRRLSDPLTEFRRALPDPLRDLVGAVRDTLFSRPWPPRPPAPLPPGALALNLSTQPPADPPPPGQVGWGCNDALAVVRLVVEEGTLVTEPPVLWPRGFSARTVDGRGELVAPDGTVVGREGEVLEAGGGWASEDQYFEACTIGGVSYPPAS